MADEAGAIQSVFEFSQDVASQEAPPPIPKGKYQASITAAEPKVSTTSGNTYIDVTFTISPDQFPADFAAIQMDAVNVHYRSLVMKDDARARYNLRRFCEKVRCTVSRKFDVNDLIGKVAKIEIDHRQYQGVDQPEIKGIEAD